MKKLKKILLINWLYFSRQVIEVEDVNFLTGKNGAGKSTIIDALQIVCLGELNTRIFNKAANESSQRTLDGYLRADMDEKAAVSRRGKDFSSYIACEFWDEQENKSFVQGIVFDCRSDGSRQERFFLYNGKIPEDCFIRNRQPLDIAELRAYLKEQYGTRQKLYDSHKQYRLDMLAKWNVHNEQVCRMLKKAVSFRPIVDIRQFITENICDIPDKPNIEAMQQNIRDYKRHEEMAERQEAKLKALQEISEIYQTMQKTLDRLRQQEFLVSWGQQETLRQETEKKTAEMESHQAKKEIIQIEIEEIEEKLHGSRVEKEKLSADLAQSDVFQEERRLTQEKQRLEQEDGALLQELDKTLLEIKREIQIIEHFLQNYDKWQETEQIAALLTAANGIEDACKPFTEGTIELFSKPLTIFEQMQETVRDFSTALREAAYQMEGAWKGQEEHLTEKESILQNLRKNIKDYPSGLLSLKERLTTHLRERMGKTVPVEILADVLEIAEGQEQWRGTVEGYLHTQKFYLLVPQEAYKTALQFYDRIKQEYRKQSFGLVDIGKLRERERISPVKNSLAQKVETANPLARVYVDYLLRRVTCCDDVNELRKYRVAVTAGGMLYQGYVARPIRREYMENAFIGQKAVALRMRQIETEIVGLREAMQRMRPVCQELEKQKNHEFLFTGYFVQNVIAQRQKDYLCRLEIRKELAEISEQFALLDFDWLDKVRQRIENLQMEIQETEKKKEDLLKESGGLDTKIEQLTNMVLPNLQRELREKTAENEERFTPQFREEIGIPRYQQEILRLKQPTVIVKNFGDSLQRTYSEETTVRHRLFAKREEYVRSFPPCSFQTTTLENDEFAEEQRRLEENELPKYREKIRLARESAMEQFQNDFLAKLKSGIDQVTEQVKNLNKALKQAQFGTDKYQFRVERNPDFGAYYDMIMAPELMEGEGGLFAEQFQKKYGSLIEELFSRIATSDDTQLNARKQSELQQNIERYTDFRTYLKFDLETTDQNGNTQRLSQTLHTKSGGETQTPFYIAVLASFLQLYQVNNPSRVASNTARLVIFDEAFNKMDSERIVESVRLLRKMHLQAIICTPPDKLSDIMPLADRTFLVHKDKYKMQVLTYGKEITE